MDLLGRTILITRAASQSGDLRTGLEAHGARVLECPAIEIVPVDDWTAVDRAAANVNSYQWIIFTSANAVDHCMPRVSLQGVVCQVPIATVGTSTARKLQEWNLSASRIPASFRAEGLLEAFPSDLRGERILIPRAEAAREVLPEELRRRGATVDVVAVYRTVKSDAGLTDLKTTLSREMIDVIAFTSPSAIRSFAESLGEELSVRLRAVPIAVIGPVAREAAEALGLKVAIQPDRATVQDLIESIRAALT
jgi:uroporphyrinogen III methyltransferase/synthase